MNKKIIKMVHLLSIIIAITILSTLILPNKVYAGNGFKTYQGFKYRIENGAACIYSYNRNSSKVVIPDTIENKKVTGFNLDRKGTANLSKAKEITIGAYMGSYFNTSEGDYLKGCRNLTKIKVSKKNRIYYSESGVLFQRDKGGIKLINYPSKKQTPNGTYSIPEGVTSIGEFAFSGCSKIQRLNLPKSVVKIDETFEDCVNLKTFHVASKNSKFASKDGGLYDKNIKALIKCPNQISAYYKFPKTVTEIKMFAFGGNAKLKEITIPIQIKKIDNLAFQNCKNLKTVCFKNKQKKVDFYMFQSTALNKLIVEDLNTMVSAHKGEDLDEYCLAFGGCAREIFEKDFGNTRTLYCKKGSKAEAMALKYNLNMKYI